MQHSPQGDAHATTSTLRSSIRQAIRQLAWGGVVSGLSLGLGFSPVCANAQAFPPTVQLRSLLPAAGGDGSEGFVIVPTQADATLSPVASAGDLNGDGFNDIVVAWELGDANGQSNTGQVFVVYGGNPSSGALFSLGRLFPGAGGDGTEGVVINGVFSGDTIGDTLAPLGDVNGDGLGDLGIGVGDSLKFGNSGLAYVLFGQPGGFGPVVQLAALDPDNGGDGSRGILIEGVFDASVAGRSIVPAGDFNHDGIDDFLVGADDDQTNAPIDQFLVFGRTDGFLATLDLASLRPEAGGDGSQGVVLRQRGEVGYFHRLGAAGDVNGDGVDDVWVMASNGTDAPRDAIHVAFGSASPGALVDLDASDGSDGFLIRLQDASGTATVSRAGDFNADGVDDLLIGDPFLVAPEQSGAAYVLFGNANGFPAEVALADLRAANGGDGSAGVVFLGPGLSSDTGGAVSHAGDINGDGLDDVLVGAYSAPFDIQETTGQAYLLLGDDDGFAPEIDLEDLFARNGGDGSLGVVFNGIDAGDRAGDTVTALGDVNGDGIDDFAVSAEFADPFGLRDGGEVYVIYGRTAP